MKNLLSIVLLVAVTSAHGMDFKSFFNWSGATAWHAVCNSWSSLTPTQQYVAMGAAATAVAAGGIAYACRPLDHRQALDQVRARALGTRHDIIDKRLVLTDKDQIIAKIPYRNGWGISKNYYILFAGMVPDLTDNSQSNGIMRHRVAINNTLNATWESWIFKGPDANDWRYHQQAGFESSKK